MAMGVGTTAGGGAVLKFSWGSPAPKGAATPSVASVHKQAQDKLPKTLKARPPRTP